MSPIYAQLTHALGLNDVCDALRLNAGPLSALRGATPPSVLEAGSGQPCRWKINTVVLAIPTIYLLPRVWVPDKQET